MCSDIPKLVKGKNTLCGSTLEKRIVVLGPKQLIASVELFHKLIVLEIMIFPPLLYASTWKY